MSIVKYKAYNKYYNSLQELHLEDPRFQIFVMNWRNMDLIIMAKIYFTPVLQASLWKHIFIQDL